MPRFKDRITEPDRRLIAEWLHGSTKQLFYRPLQD